MYRRLLHFSLLLVVAAGLWIKGRLYFQHVHAGQAGTTEGLLELAYLLTMISLASIILRSLLRDRRKRSELLAKGEASEPRETSLSENVARLQTIARRAFVRRPVLVSGLLLGVTAVLGSIPIVLVALATAGGISAFGPVEWLVVGLAELPIFFIAIRIAFGLMAGQRSSR